MSSFKKITLIGFGEVGQDWSAVRKHALAHASDLDAMIDTMRDQTDK
jgi:hypothetical protein